MPTAIKSYLDTVKNQVGYTGSWLPGSIVEIGHIGTMRDGAFVYQTSLQELRVPFRKKTDDAPSMRFASSSGVAFTGSGKGKTNKALGAIGRASAGIKIAFSHKGALAFVLEGVTEDSIRNVNAVAAWMAKNKDRKINSDQVVITHVRRARSGVIAMSNEGGAEVQLKTDVDVGSGKLSIAKVGGNLELVMANKTEFVSIPHPKDGMTPLFRFLRYKEWHQLGTPVVQEIVMRASR
jgi:hypothetical protein